MPAATAPIIIAARSTITHSGRLKPRIHTASPGLTPSATRARAAHWTVAIAVGLTLLVQRAMRTVPDER